MKMTQKKRRQKKVTEKTEIEVEPGKKKAVADQREIAKAGMVSSLGTLFLTGFVRFKGARGLHTWAGWALLGFSIWHHILSSPKYSALSKDE
ncbi:MAG: hypothetical protein PVJ77_06430 [Desulfobacterales bacterium]